MRVTVGSTITIEQPSQELCQWCKQHLRIRNPDYSKKVRMHFWLGNTPETLSLFETRGDTLVLPFGTLRAIAPMLGLCAVISDFSEGQTVDFNCDVPLYSYQGIAVDEVLKYHYGILQSPAGSGKTQMGISLVARLGKRTLLYIMSSPLKCRQRSTPSGITSASSFTVMRCTSFFDYDNIIARFAVIVNR